MCIRHLYNTSLFPIFYRTQVLPMVQKFSKIFDKKNFLYTTCFVLLYFTSQKHSPKMFKNLLLNFSTFTFQCLKLAIVKVFLFSEFLASALLVTLVENELSLEP